MFRDASAKRRAAVYSVSLLVFCAAELYPGVSDRFLHPDFLLIFPVMAGLWTSGYDGIVTGLLCGFIRDFAAGRGYGAGMLFLMFAGLLVSRIAPYGRQQLALAALSATVAVTLANEFLFAFLSWLIPLSRTENALSSMISASVRRLPSALVSSLAACVIIGAVFYIGFHKRKNKDSREEIDLSFAEGDAPHA